MTAEKAAITGYREPSHDAVSLRTTAHDHAVSRERDRAFDLVDMPCQFENESDWHLIHGFRFHFEFHRAGKIGKRTQLDETGRQVVVNISG